MTSEEVTNSDVFLWALFELGGDEGFIDVEDAFWRAFELAPQRLSWRTRPDIPDLKRCSKALRDAEKRSPQLLVKQGSELRRLTVAGQKWIEENFDRLAELLGADRVVQAPRQRSSGRLLAQVTGSDVFKEWLASRSVPGEKWRVADLLRCSPDSARSIWKDRLATLMAAAYAADRAEVSEILGVARCGAGGLVLRSVVGKHRVLYGGRAFSQDAAAAMKANIVRGIIELLTNCDDAYGDSPNGKVRIEVEHRRNKPWRVIVRDRAGGMRAARMKEAIGGLGGRTSGFESGADVRGNLGRGAKDLAAFGDVVFESVCDGRYSCMTLEMDGSYDDPLDRSVTADDRDRLGIPAAAEPLCRSTCASNSVALDTGRCLTTSPSTTSSGTSTPILAEK